MICHFDLCCRTVITLPYVTKCPCVLPYAVVLLICNHKFLHDAVPARRHMLLTYYRVVISCNVL